MRFSDTNYRAMFTRCVFFPFCLASVIAGIWKPSGFHLDKPEEQKMWRFVMVAALASMTLLPKAALATVYDFHDTETSALSPSPVSFTFSLVTTTAGSGGGVTSFSNVAIDKNGVSSSGNTVDALFTTNLSSSLFFLVDTALEPFYSGSGTSIIFNPGTFAIADGFTDAEGTLTISTASASAIPEPATWTLLFAGVAMTAAFQLSRKLSRSSRGICPNC